jgi:hypothetical protein
MEDERIWLRLSGRGRSGGGTRCRETSEVYGQRGAVVESLSCERDAVAWRGEERVARTEQHARRWVWKSAFKQSTHSVIC